MRELVLASLVFASCAVACKHPGSAKLEGKWKGQRADGVPAESQLAATLFAQGTEIAAQGNQITITTPAAKNVSATYVIDKEDATTLVIHTDKDGTPETFTFNDGADEMTWKVDQQRAIVFKKLR